MGTPRRRATMKYVVVSGGVVSGLGKGVTASSIGVLLKASGLRVTSVKIDPYINIDAGTMSPFEHGETYVLDDGGESDLDLGNYERFVDVSLTRDHNITTGKVYQSVMGKEREGKYLGKTVQVVPHITDEIQDWIERVAHVPVDGTDNVPDVCVIELGGTVGDIESMPFIEALRQFQFRVGTENFCLIPVSLVPVVGAVGEQKTKPTQHSIQALRSAGLSPHMLACRSKHPLEQSVMDKLALFCHVNPKCIINLCDVSNIWHMPLVMLEQDALRNIMFQLQLPYADPDMQQWEYRAKKWDAVTTPVTIALSESTLVWATRTCPSPRLCCTAPLRAIVNSTCCGSKRAIWRRKRRARMCPSTKRLGRASRRRKASWFRVVSAVAVPKGK